MPGNGAGTLDRTFHHGLALRARSGALLMPEGPFGLINRVALKTAIKFGSGSPKTTNVC